MADKQSKLARLPFYYGWVIVAITFVTMAIGVTARTAFSLLLPPLLDEFKWDRGLAAGAFSFGFLVSAVASPVIGSLMDRYGPRLVVEMGVVFLVSGLLLAPIITQPWQLYLTLGVLVGVGVNCLGYTVQSQFLPNWFMRRRGFAISVAFSGVGVGAIILLPWMQTIILRDGWRASCTTLGLVALIVLLPINLLLWKHPSDIGLRPDGDAQPKPGVLPSAPSNIVDPVWACTEWTVGRAVRTGRFWWLALGYFCGLFAWYAVQIHQTKYLIEVGFGASEAAWALGLVSCVAIPGQIALGALSDRFGREWIWVAGCAGFAMCYAALIGLEGNPDRFLLYVMVVTQGLLGYGLTSVMGPIVAEIFEGPYYGSVFGTMTIALIAGGAAGPFVTGLIHDRTGNYKLAFLLSIACCIVSACAIWIAAPRKVRLVPGKIKQATTAAS